MESGRTLDNYSVGGNTNARVIEEAQPEKKAVITSGRGEGQKYKKDITPEKEGQWSNMKFRYCSTVICHASFILLYSFSASGRTCGV